MKTLIIGGGLSGLAIAHALEARGHDYMLVEARDRFGGRIKTEHLDGGSFDMGPAWFWDGQPRIASMVSQFGLEVFEQFDDGILTFEDAQGQVQRGRGFASMQGSWRLKGGLSALTDALDFCLTDGRKALNARVESVSRTESGATVTLSDGTHLSANKIVLAMPPRIAATLAFAPQLPAQTRDDMENISTWMAGQAKAVAVYDTPFWREDGLSGDATSRMGPMVEIHDASPAQGAPFALFGFIGVAPAMRQDETALRHHTLAQLVRLFGPKAAKPKQLFIKDWAFDPMTSTDADKAPLYAHPTYGLSPAMADVWDDTLLFAGTEVASQFGGYLEGALEAAEDVLRKL